MSLCCIVEWSEVEHKKATYSERQSWVSVCWLRKIKNRSSSVGAHYSTDKQMSRRFTMISYAGRCQANTRCISKYIIKESLAQLANLVFVEFSDVWVKFADLYILISSKFLRYFQIDDGSVLPKMVRKKERSQGRKINGPGAVIYDVMIQRLWRFSSSQFCHFLQYVWKQSYCLCNSSGDSANSAVSSAL